MRRLLSSWRPTAAVGAAVVASVAIAACGASSPSRAGTASAARPGLKFAACVRAHGVPDFPDPGAIGADGTPAKTLSESAGVVQKAQDACRRYAEAAAAPLVSSAQLARLKAGALAYARCVRGHGVPDFPDPTVETGPGGHGAGISPPFGTGASARAHAQSPTLQAAIETCSSLVNKVTPGFPAKKG